MFFGNFERTMRHTVDPEDRYIAEAPKEPTKSLAAIILAAK
jgi:hypothetical protein